MGVLFNDEICKGMLFYIANASLFSSFTLTVKGDTTFTDIKLYIRFILKFKIQVLCLIY